MKALGYCKYNAREDILIQLPEETRHVMILQNSPVIVEDCQVRAGVDVKVVSGAAVIKVVNDGGHEAGEDFQIGEPGLEKE